MIKNLFFPQMGGDITQNDTYQENDPQSLGRGILQRYLEIIGQEADEYMLPKIAHLTENTQGLSVLDTLVPIRERSMGLLYPLYDAMEDRRWLLPYLNVCHRHKGNFQNYVFLLGRLGFDVVIEEFYQEGTWDDGTWDLFEWDSYANINGSFHLTLNVRYVLSVTPALTAQIERIIEWNKPIHAQEVTYNIVGFEPAIELNTDVLDFGTVIVGNTPQLHFFITNVGNAPLTISEIQIPFATYTLSWGGGILAANETQQVFITFTPTSTAVQNGIITVVSNAVSGGNTISVTGQGFVNIGFKLNGLTNYVRAPHNAAADVPSNAPHTYSMMFRTAPVDNGQPNYVWHYQTTNTGMATYAGDLYFSKNVIPGGAIDQMKVVGVIQPNNLYHVVVVNNGIGVTGVTIYVNGVQRTLVPLNNGGVTGTPAGAFVMGIYLDGGYFHFGGQIFHWRKYNIAMSQAQVVEEYNTGYRLGALEPALLSAYEVQEVPANYGILQNDKAGMPDATLFGFSPSEVANSRVDINGNPYTP